MSDSYRTVIRTLPLPTPEQTERFASFVTSTHSWYKHLPLFFPGAPFLFFLDPNAGRRLMWTSAGERFVDCVEDKHLFHGSMRITRDYRDLFGYWQYANEWGNCFASGGGKFVKFKPEAREEVRGQLMSADWSQEEGWAVLESAPRVMDVGNEWIDIPSDLVNVGTCWVTGLVHPRFLLRTKFPDNPIDGIRQFAEAAKSMPNHPDVIVYREFESLAEKYRDAAEKKRKRIEEELSAWHKDEQLCQIKHIEATLFRVRAFLSAQNLDKRKS